MLYRRERSNIWQCRYKVDGRWQRATTKERDLKKAKEAAKVLLIKAEIRKQENLSDTHIGGLIRTVWQQTGFGNEQVDIQRLTTTGWMG